MISIDSRRKTNFAVTLTPCRFKDHTYVARVPRRTVTSDQLLDLVSAHNQGIDRYQVGHAMELLKKEILEQAELGFAVDIMEICKLYVAPISSVTTLTPEAESVTGFEARFAVNDKLRDRLRAVTATVTAVVDPAPQIARIENPMDSKAGLADGMAAPADSPSEVALSATFSARLRGHKLKVGGGNGGIFFAPAVKNKDTGAEEADMDEFHWIPVPDEFVTKNTEGTLEFHLPRSLEAGSRYFIVVRTAARGNKELKSPLTGCSKIPVTVR